MEKPKGEEWTDQLCTSCTSTPEPEVVYIRGSREVVCIPWDGDLDDENRPVTSTGEVVMPGRRTCHHSDCVNPAHVRRPYKKRGQAA